MKLITSLALCALVGGCANTPADVLERGESRVITSKLAQDGFVKCLVRNAQDNNIIVIARESGAPGWQQVLFSTTANSPLSTLAVAEIPPIGPGTIWLANDLLTKDRFMSKVGNGC